MAGSRNMTVENCHTRADNNTLAIASYDHHFEVPGFTSVRHAYEN